MKTYKNFIIADFEIDINKEGNYSSSFWCKGDVKKDIFTKEPISFL